MLPLRNPRRRRLLQRVPRCLETRVLRARPRGGARAPRHARVHGRVFPVRVEVFLGCGELVGESGEEFGSEPVGASPDGRLGVADAHRAQRVDSLDERREVRARALARRGHGVLEPNLQVLHAAREGVEVVVPRRRGDVQRVPRAALSERFGDSRKALANVVEALLHLQTGGAAEDGRRGSRRELRLRVAHVQQIFAPLLERVQLREQRALLPGPTHFRVVGVPFVHGGARKLEGTLPRVARLDGSVQSVHGVFDVPVEYVADRNVLRAPPHHLVGDFPEQTENAVLVVPLGGVPHQPHAVRDAGHKTRHLRGFRLRQRLARRHERVQEPSVFLRRRKLTRHDQTQLGKGFQVRRARFSQHANDRVDADVVQLSRDAGEVARARVPKGNLRERAVRGILFRHPARFTRGFVRDVPPRRVRAAAAVAVGAALAAVRLAHDFPDLPRPVNDDALQSPRELLVARGALDFGFNRVARRRVVRRVTPSRSRQKQERGLLRDVQHRLAPQLVRAFGEPGEVPVRVRREFILDAPRPRVVPKHRGRVHALDHLE